MSNEIALVVVYAFKTRSGAVGTGRCILYATGSVKTIGDYDRVEARVKSENPDADEIIVTSWMELGL